MNRARPQIGIVSTVLALALGGASTGNARAQALAYVRAGAPVRWQVEPPGEGWTSPGFDDHAWTVAPMPLIGEGRTPGATLAAQQLPAGTRSVFVRVRFRLGPEQAQLRSLTLRVRFGEGLAAFIDGKEVARRYLAADASPGSLSTQIHGTEYEDFAIPIGGAERAAFAAAGEHVLALEVHAHSATVGPQLDATLAGAEGVRLVRGPYLLRPGAGEMTVLWQTDLDAPGEVQYGPTMAYGNRLASPVSVRHHALRLTGLSPSRTYHYRVLAGAADSGDLQFHTLPGPDEPLRFAVYGDTRSGHVVHARLATQVLAEDPDFILSLGDLVDRGSEEADWQRFFEVAQPLLRQVPLVPALGNHEMVRSEGLSRFLEQFPAPAGAPEPGYYSLDVSGVHITVLDSNQLRSPRQLAWCQADLGRARHARARFVAMHQGPWSVGFHGNNADAIRSYVPIFQAENVQLIFSGHDHEYERGRVDGVSYVVSGGGGAPLYTPRCGGGRPPCPPSTFFVASEYHYLLVEVQHESFRVCAKRLDGTALEPCVDYPLGRDRK